jgi:transposase
MICVCSTKTAGCWRLAGSPTGWPARGSCTPWWPPIPRTQRRSRGIETDRGLLVGALLAAGYQVYAVNPQVVSHYRSRHGSARAKSDRGDAKVLADLVRTDRHNHRPVAGDSPLAEAVKVLARAHQSLIWSRQRHVNALRRALRDFYPGALSALGTQLAEPESLAVLALARPPSRAGG